MTDHTPDETPTGPTSEHVHEWIAHPYDNVPWCACGAYLTLAYANNLEAISQAARPFVGVVETALPAINGCILAARTHGVYYEGPQLLDELLALKAVLRALDARAAVGSEL